MAHKNSQGEINHSIVEQKNVPPLGNFPDYIRSQPNLKTSIQTNDGKIFVTITKDDLFGKHYTPDQEIREGYERINLL